MVIYRLTRYSFVANLLFENHWFQVWTCILLQLWSSAKRSLLYKVQALNLSQLSLHVYVQRYRRGLEGDVRIYYVIIKSRIAGILLGKTFCSLWISYFFGSTTYFDNLFMVYMKFRNETDRVGLVHGLIFCYSSLQLNV